MLHRIAHAPSRRRRGPVRRPRTPWRRWRSLRVGTTTGRPGIETQGAGRGRTIEAQWQNDRPLKVSHRAFKEALRRGSWNYHGKRQGGRERTAPICRLTSVSYSASRTNRGKHTKSGERLRTRETAASRRGQTPASAPAASAAGPVAEVAYFHTLRCLPQGLIGPYTE